MNKGTRCWLAAVIALPRWNGFAQPNGKRGVAVLRGTCVGLAYTPWPGKLEGNPSNALGMPPPWHLGWVPTPRRNDCHAINRPSCVYRRKSVVHMRVRGSCCQRRSIVFFPTPVTQSSLWSTPGSRFGPVRAPFPFVLQVATFSHA